jgi:hypothetical protein
MMPEETARIWRMVWRRMGDWERGEANGSARATFEHAWDVAVAELHPVQSARVTERERAWQHWLERGYAPTLQVRERLLRNARTRAYQGELFGLDHIREPGEEG